MRIPGRGREVSSQMEPHGAFLPQLLDGTAFDTLALVASWVVALVRWLG
jgi:hypothetical protein